MTRPGSNRSLPRDKILIYGALDTPVIVGLCVVDEIVLPTEIQLSKNHRADLRVLLRRPVIFHVEVVLVLLLDVPQQVPDGAASPGLRHELLLRVNRLSMPCSKRNKSEKKRPNQTLARVDSSESKSRQPPFQSRIFYRGSATMCLMWRRKRKRGW